MKNTLLCILTLVGIAAFSQEQSLDQIKVEVSAIDSDSTLEKRVFELAELTGITTDGGGTLVVWHNEKQICKIVEEVGLSFGRIRTIIYLSKGKPIKIIESEENFESKGETLNQGELREVYREVYYVFDWEMAESEIIRTGKRNQSEASCSMFELAEGVLELAEEAHGTLKNHKNPSKRKKYRLEGLSSAGTRLDSLIDFSTIVKIKVHNNNGLREVTKEEREQIKSYLRESVSVGGLLCKPTTLSVTLIFTDGHELRGTICDNLINFETGLVGSFRFKETPNFQNF